MVPGAGANMIDGLLRINQKTDGKASNGVSTMSVSYAASNAACQCRKREMTNRTATKVEVGSVHRIDSIGVVFFAPGPSGQTDDDRHLSPSQEMEDELRFRYFANCSQFQVEVRPYVVFGHAAGNVKRSCGGGG